MPDSLLQRNGDVRSFVTFLFTFPHSCHRCLLSIQCKVPFHSWEEDIIYLHWNGRVNDISQTNNRFWLKGINIQNSKDKAYEPNWPARQDIWHLTLIVVFQKVFSIPSFILKALTFNINSFFPSARSSYHNDHTQSKLLNFSYIKIDFSKTSHP